jgi:integrase
MVDPKLVDVRSIPDEVRYRIFDYLWSRGVRASDLGIDSTYANKVRNRRIRVSDALLEEMIEMLTFDELAMLLGSTPQARQQVVREPRDIAEAILAVDQYVGGLEAVLDKYPQLSNIVYQKVVELLRTRIRSYTITVTKEHLDAFEKLLKSKAPKTRADRMRYLLKALNDLGWELSQEKLQEYIAELYEESPNVAQHVAKALKLFIKHVIRDPNLYQSFKTPKVEYGLSATPLTLETVRVVAKAIEWPPAKAYFALLAETGLRPGEVLNLRMQNIDLSERMVRVMRVGNTKRSYISFFSERLRDYLRDVYLPYREEFVKSSEDKVRKLLRDEVSEWRNLLLPFEDSALRAAIYSAMDKVLGKRFRLYDLRVFFASYMSLRGVPGQIIDLLQGRAPPKEFQVLARHYLAINIKELREMYDKAGLIVLE